MEPEGDKSDEEEPPEAEEPEEKPAKRHQIPPGSMVQPEQDNQRMLKWRRELGPDKRIYRDD